MSILQKGDIVYMESDILTLSTSTLNLIWLGLFIILIIIEIFTVGLTTIWCAIGDLAAMAANTLGAGLIVQSVVFLAVSVVLLLFTRPWAEKHLNKNRLKTNYESKIGEVIRITERVDNLKQTGKSIVDGQEWTVRAQNSSETFEKDELAEVVDVSGVKLIVKKHEEVTS